MIVCFRLIGLFFAIALMASVSEATVPIGHFDTPSPGQTLVIWDLSGSYQATDGLTTTTFDIAQDDKGKITGSGTEQGSSGGIDIDLAYSILGFIKTIPDRQQPGSVIAKVKLVLKAVGTATSGGTTLPVTGNLTANFEIAGNTISGPTRGRVCLKGFRCGPVNDFHSFTLPAGATNSWSLIADLQSPDGKKLLGSGSIDLSNGRSVPLNFAGLYNATADTFKLNTARDSPGKVVIQQASVAGTTMLIQKLKGKIMGQVLK